jgi:hypothetical protein
MLFMSKNKPKTKPAPLPGDNTTADENKDEISKLQARLAKLQSGLDCLFGYLVRKNIINADEFKAYLINEFKSHPEERTADNADLQGCVSITYYNRESMEFVQ